MEGGALSQVRPQAWAASEVLIAGRSAATEAAAAVDLATGWGARCPRADFPILSRQVHGRPLIYLDTAASAQKPRAVIDTMRAFCEGHYANVHRGGYTLSYEATQAFESAREKVAGFLNAGRASEIVFVRGATEAINLVAATFGRSRLRAGDEIILSELEHHANIVPWQMLRDATGIVLKIAAIDEDGALRGDAIARQISERTRLIAVTHVSNVLGSLTPVSEIAQLARQHGAFLLVDGCQAVPHRPVDVQALDCDFYAFSGHKLYGPSGIGVLWAKQEILESMPPYQGGGEMILSVSFESTTFKKPPHRFEAGTPAIVEAVGLAAAIDYLGELGLDRIEAQERHLRAYAVAGLRQIAGLRLLPGGDRPGGIVSFVMDRAHPHDISTILDHAGIAIRAGHHCAQPLMQRLAVPATARLSLGVYNTEADVDALLQAVASVREILG